MVEKLVFAFLKPAEANSVEARHLTQPKGSLTFHPDAASSQSLGWLYRLCVLFDLI